ncbi:MAG: dethiobiotin synthase [SAR324 cluster bacterium]|nr:dethiobiotin synthase [SAR324 cluster bacterium]
MKKSDFPPAFWVSGTNTDIGKTLVSAILLKWLGYSYYKPVQSGSLEGTDTNTIKELTQLPDSQFLPESVLLKEPLSPHTAAAMEGVTIDLDSINLPKTRPLLIEGAGGLLVPLNEDKLLIDLMVKFQLPVLLVASSGLGTINHTLLSIESLRTRGLELLGVILNGPLNQSNKKAVEHYGQTRVLLELEKLSDVTPESLEKYITHLEK